MRAFVISLVLAAATPAAASPGPDSVVVVANANVPESVALADAYAVARAVPRNRVCALDLPVAEDISLDDYRARLLDPLRACLDAGGVRDRIEAAVLIRGVPLRVDVPVPDGDGAEIVSLAAALSLWDSTLDDGTPLLGQPPGVRVDCGGFPCYAATWRNPYRLSYAFDPGWSSDRDGVRWRPILVTMLHGRSFEDARMLLDSAIAAEGAPPTGEPTGEILFMEGADPARGVLDVQYDEVIAELAALGITNASRTPFDPDLTGRTLAAFFVGTAGIGTTIEGNTFQPGSLVDNVTSYGAAPQNFRESGEDQVSIARWVARGVAGAHGTVEEPLNNCFPHRHLIVSYAQGATLAEAFHEHMPYAYWRNLVLGDPMAAPYAMRPQIALEGVGDRTAGAIALSATAEDPRGRGIESIAVLLDGVEVARGTSDALEACVAVPAGEHELLVVARAAGDPSEVYNYREKGWVLRAIESDGATTDCTVAPPDAGAIDAGSDAGSDAGRPTEVVGDCGCRAGRETRAPWLLAALALLAISRRREGRSRRIAE